MKKLLFLSAIIVVSACNNKPETVKPKAEPDVIVQSDGVNDYTARAIDSLKYTYSQPTPPAAYVVTKSDRVSINLTPLDVWEKLYARDSIFIDPIHVQKNWVKIHRTEFCNLTSGARPWTETETEGKIDVFIPLDGTCSSCLQELVRKYPDKEIALTSKEAFMVTITNGVELTSSGIQLTGLTRKQVDYLRAYFPK